MNGLRFLTSSPAGDLIAMMAGIKQICKDTKQKATIYQRLGMVGEGYAGATHPFKNNQGLPVAINEYMFDMLYPLITYQDYVDDYVIYSGEEIDINLDKGRLEIFTGQPKNSLNRWIFHPYPQMSCDLSKKWLDVPIMRYDESMKYVDKIFINHTFRYRNYTVNYFFLKKYEPQIIFVGLPEEHEFFCHHWKLNVPLLEVKNFLELATKMNCCKFFSGNQSANFQIAESLKVKRILEIFEPMPNVIPIGEHAYDFFHQTECEYYFDKLHNLA